MRTFLPGHIEKNCRVPVYNYGEAPEAAAEQYDVQQWYEDPFAYDGHWWNNSMGQHGQDTHHHSQQLALPAPQMATSSGNAPPIQIVSGIQCQEPSMIAHIHDNTSGQQTTYVDIMEQLHMSAHHGLHKNSQYNLYQQTMDHNYEQSLTMRSDSTDTNGYTCTM